MVFFLSFRILKHVWILSCVYIIRIVYIYIYIYMTLCIISFRRNGHDVIRILSKNLFFTLVIIIIYYLLLSTIIFRYTRIALLTKRIISIAQYLWCIYIPTYVCTMYIHNTYNLLNIERDTEWEERKNHHVPNKLWCYLYGLSSGRCSASPSH